MIKLLIGGSPCTFWSIAQKNNRETEAEGLGWELFKNYLVAKEKFKPDFFLYENNKSAAKPIREQISKKLDVDLMYINSALVSAQNRQRFYAFNWKVEQPKDRGIVLQDILESGTNLTQNEKGYCLTASYNGACAWNTIERNQRNMVIEAICVQEQVKGRKANSDGTYTRQYEARNDGKSGTLTGTMRQNSVAVPVNDTKNGKSQTIKGQYNKTSIANICCYKSTYGATGVAVPSDKTDNAGKTAIQKVYEVKDGLITIKDKQYPIKLVDGFYIIRKLTVKECCRLQTMPDDYCRAVSNSQAYKGLGNGWTAEVIIHILNGALKDIPKDEEIVVLSMYDGIGTGRYCLDKMGFTNIKYYAYEIDKYAMQIAMSNYPDIIQCGDGFALCNENWHL